VIVINRLVAYALAVAVLFVVVGCSSSKPVATEEEGMRGMQNMDSGAENAP
jgi:predicted component of type VI protein secretion system